jgi:Na+/phosphate symporter
MKKQKEEIEKRDEEIKKVKQEIKVSHQQMKETKIADSDEKSYNKLFNIIINGLMNSISE